MFQLILENFLEFFHFGPDHKIAVGHIAIVFVIVLMVILGFVESAERRDLCNDRSIKCAALVQRLFVL